MTRPSRGADDRRRTNRAGRRAEWFAAAALVLKGYRILALGYAVGGGEIDVVARRGGTIAFVEVKARSGFEAALAAIDGPKRRRVSRAAAVWLARHPWAAALTLRGDAVLVVPRRWPRHVVDAYPLALGR